ncbi:hypothetical protein [Halorarius litoreus]|uniref:hypothetical protein n=1 Tax=Halorarius litoreus TaxID=2962676 RepID=UPI0020CD2FA5|nr:hypothetical protein [Halorarius litoreus]
MVVDELTDGTRIAQLLSSEVHGRESGPTGRLSVVDADRDVEPTEFGAFAYGIDFGGARLADVYVHPDRAHLEVRRGVDTAADAAGDAGLRVRPKAVDPPRTLVFVENGAEVKRATDVLATVVDALSTEEPGDPDT